MLRFWELAPSPNNTKVRMALRFKGIEFEVLPVDPRDRSELVQATGQELSPAIEDRGIVLNDSDAILQYLDANYRETPRIFPADRDGRKACDAWRQTIESRVARPWLPVFLHALGLREEMDPDSPRRFVEALEWLEKEVGDDGRFLGGLAPFCDLFVAEFVTYALPGAGLLERVPLFGRVRDQFGVEPGRFPRLEAFVEPWNDRLA